MATPDMTFDADYFLRGRELGVSCYTDYTWQPGPTTAMADAFAQLLGMRWQDRVLDFGCARGYLVRALCGLGYNAHGVDISHWATHEGADPNMFGRLHYIPPGPTPDLRRLGHRTDWIIAKDVFEHVPLAHIDGTLEEVLVCATKGAAVVVPVTHFTGEGYIEPDDELDTTHVVRWSRRGWLEELKGAQPAWAWRDAGRVPGIKDHRASAEGYAILVGLAP